MAFSIEHNIRDNTAAVPLSGTAGNGIILITQRRYRTVRLVLVPAALPTKCIERSFDLVELPPARGWHAFMALESPLEGAEIAETTGFGDLSGTTSHTGATTVHAGTLRLGNGVSPANLANTSDVIVAPGAMLDLNYTSTDLSGWTDVPLFAGGMVAMLPDMPQAGIDMITITLPEGPEPRIFGLLQVSVQP